MKESYFKGRVMTACGAKLRNAAKYPLDFLFDLNPTEN